MIKIIDDFLTQNELEEIKKYADAAQWKLQTSSQNFGLPFLYCNLTNNTYFNDYLFSKIKNKLEIDLILDRVYFNGQWSGREGNLHQDGCDLTCLLYISEYDYNWGGFTQIIKSDKEQEIVLPLQKRLLCFPGNLFHKGYSFSYQDCPMRVTLAYKMMIDVK